MESWVEAASFVDDDDLAFSETDCCGCTQQLPNNT
jgi:hypothetical protein